MDKEYEELATNLSRYLPFSYTKTHEWTKLLWAYGFSVKQITEFMQGCLKTGINPEILIEVIYKSRR